MHKLLMLIYYFPPQINGGIQRPIKFAKYLPQCNWKPVIIAPNHSYVANKDYKPLLDIKDRADVFLTSPYWIPKVDILSRKIKITNNIILKIIYKILSGFIRVAFIPDKTIVWSLCVIPKAIKIIRRYKINCLYATSPPESTLITGIILKLIFNIPLVIDLRDAWIDEPQKRRTRPYRKISLLIENILEYYIFKKCNNIITINNTIINDISKRYIKLPSSKFIVITNGYDPDDYIDLNIRHNINIEKDKINFTFTGSFLGLRTPKYFLEALENITNCDMLNKIRVNFVGNISNEYKHKILNNKSLSNIVKIYGNVTREESLYFQINSDVLILITTIPLSEGGGQEFSGKLYEYIGARKPIFAMIPENGELANYILSNKLGWVVQYDDVNNISNQIISIINLLSVNNYLFSPNKGVYANINRKYLSIKLSLVLNEIVK